MCTDLEPVKLLDALVYDCDIDEYVKIWWHLHGDSEKTEFELNARNIKQNSSFQ